MGAIDTLPLAEQIEAIYIGYFGRAADAGGLSYWEQYYSQLIASGHTVDQTLNIIANDFAPQTETVGLYPFLAGSITTLSTANLQTLVTQIYQNLFGHNPDAGGETYWVGQLQSGAVPLGSAILDIANGATGVDTTVLADRIAVANTFSSETAAAGIGTTSVSQTFITEARDVILSIGAGGNNTSADLTEQISEADQAIAAFVANGGTVVTGPGLIGGTGPGDSPLVTFTPGQDNLTGYGGDTFVAPLAGVVGAQSATLQSGDSAIEISPATNAVLDATFNPTNAGTETFGFFHFFGEYTGNLVTGSGSGGFFFAKTTTIDGPNYVNATLEGIATWNLTGTGDIYGYGPFVAINGGPNVTGLNTVNVINSSVETWFDIGTGGANFQPLLELVTTIGASNDAGGDKHYSSGVDIVQKGSLFTSTTAVQVNLSNAGVPFPASDMYSDDYVRGVDQTFTIADGPDSGKAGVVTWNIASGGAANFIFLETNGATSAKTINITGAGALTLFGNGEGEFKNLTTVNGSAATGDLTITGALNGYNGLLADSPLLASITGGSGNNLFDMSGYTLAQLDAMTAIDGGVGGTNEVVLAGEVLTALTAAIPNLTDFTVIGWGGDYGDGPAPGGTINWADLPATANELIFYHGVSGSAGLVINHTPTTFTVNFQDENFHHNTVTINGPTTGIANMLTLDVGSTITGNTASGLAGGSHDQGFTINGYNIIDLQVYGSGTTDLSHSFFATPNPLPGSTVTLNITGHASDIYLGTDGTGSGDGAYAGDGSVYGYPSGPVTGYPGAFSDGYLKISDVGTPLVGVGAAGSIVDTNSGFLYLGPTDATNIDASGSGGIEITCPDVTTLYLVTEVGSPTNWNQLQGSLGPVTLNAYDATTNINGNSAYTGPAGPTNITGGSASDWIMDTGGKEGITLSAAGGDTIFYDQFNLNSSYINWYDSHDNFMGLSAANFAMQITDNAGNFTAPGLATVTGFVVSGHLPDNDIQATAPGTADVIDFLVGSNGSSGPGTYGSWGYGAPLSTPIPNGLGGNYYGLINAEGDPVFTDAGGYSHYATAGEVSPGGLLLDPKTELVLYDPAATFANAAAVASWLNSGGAFAAPAILFTSNLSTHGDTADLLVAYNTATGMNIADITVENKTGIADTVGNVIGGHDLVSLVGVSIAQEEAQAVAHGSNILFTIYH